MARAKERAITLNPIIEAWSNMKKSSRTALMLIVAILVVADGYGSLIMARDRKDSDAPHGESMKDTTETVSVTDLQLKSIKVAEVGMHAFAPESEAPGYVDFNQDRLVQVFSPYPGIIRRVAASVGDDVKKGQLLFTVNSPDLVQAESALISAAGTLALTGKTLDRARQMQSADASAQKDVEQATADQQAAEAAYKAARNALRIFGKSEAEMDNIVASRHVDGELPVVSPFAGRVTARAAAPGLLTQPGAATAPFTVADLSTVWLIANVSENDLPHIHRGQTIAAHVEAYPGRAFSGVITGVSTALDPATHRAAVRSEIRDPLHELHPQMLAGFRIQTGGARQQPAIPDSAVVREGESVMTAFSTQDGRRFMRRPIVIGPEQDGLYPVLNGLNPGERIATDGALFISNALALRAP